MTRVGLVIGLLFGFAGWLFVCRVEARTCHVCVTGSSSSDPSAWAAAYARWPVPSAKKVYVLGELVYEEERYFYGATRWDGLPYAGVLALAALLAGGGYLGWRGMRLLGSPAAPSAQRPSLETGEGAGRASFCRKMFWVGVVGLAAGLILFAATG